MITITSESKMINRAGWTDIYFLKTDGLMTMRCPDCREKFEGYKIPNFCPNCGADRRFWEGK